MKIIYYIITILYYIYFSSLLDIVMYLYLSLNIYIIEISLSFYLLLKLLKSITLTLYIRTVAIFNCISINCLIYKTSLLLYLQLIYKREF